MATYVSEASRRTHQKTDKQRYFRRARALRWLSSEVTNPTVYPGHFFAAIAQWLSKPQMLSPGAKIRAGGEELQGRPAT